MPGRRDKDSDFYGYKAGWCYHKKIFIICDLQSETWLTFCIYIWCKTEWKRHLGSTSCLHWPKYVYNTWTNHKNDNFELIKSLDFRLQSHFLWNPMDYSKIQLSRPLKIKTTPIRRHIFGRSGLFLPSLSIPSVPFVSDHLWHSPQVVLKNL